MKLSDAIPPRPLRILLVDDNAGEAPLIRAAVKDLGIQCEIDALTESEAVLAFLRTHTRSAPDVILLDISMPKLDGYAVLDQLRRDATLRLLPVIMFSGARNPAEVERAYALGANAFIVKPMDSYRDVVGQIHSFWYSCASLPGVADAAAA